VALVDNFQQVAALLDIAVPMTEYSPSAVGAGFVDPGYVKLQFPTKEKVGFQIVPIKVLE
jgi:hypothetical protein